MAGKVHFPHDRFMKSLLGDIQVAREYFEAFLPENLKKLLDLNRLEHSPNSFISDSLKETMADIVFKCPLQDESRERLVFLSLLFEHRSTPYEFVSIQIGGYLFDSYRAQLKNKEKPLIPVIPFLYYHGTDEWVPLRMDELFEGLSADIIEFIPILKFLFENIQNYSDEQIRQLSDGLLTSALLTQKYAGKPDLLVEKFRNIFSILSSWQESNLFEALIVYYLDLVPIEKEKLNLLMDQLPEVMKTEFVSLADRLRQEGQMEGHQKGRQEGRIKGRQEGLERKSWDATNNMLQKGFEDSIICEVLDVTNEFVEKVRKSLKN